LHFTGAFHMSISSILVFVATAISLWSPFPELQPPRIPELDRIRIAEAFRVADQFRGRLWKDWEVIPFALLLVTPETEFLVRHPRPSSDFTFLGYDSLLQSDIYFRERVNQPNLLATFPAVSGLPTVVVGQAENTQARRSTRWVITLLHEHFHQLQQSQRDYYASVRELDLSGGDQSGMWMLNYPFPYDSMEISLQFQLLSRRLRETLLSPNPEFIVHLNRYIEFRNEFNRTLQPSDYRYFSFQLWQEGIARFTEVRAVEMIAEEYEPTEAFRELEDFRPFKDESRGIRFEIFSQLRTMRLKESRRSAFYPFGAAEALLLDRAAPGWKEHYFSRRFSLESLFKKE
ncbi:MAG: hypothetical protein WEB37_12160, partial [Bacteroidota bacterium]